MLATAGCGLFPAVHPKMAKCQEKKIKIPTEHYFELGKTTRKQPQTAKERFRCLFLWHMNFFFSAFRTLERAETLNLSAPEVKEQGGVEMQRPANGVAVLSRIHF